MNIGLTTRISKSPLTGIALWKGLPLCHYYYVLMCRNIIIRFIGWIWFALHVGYLACVIFT